jgi:tetratricopeptide (TPR) repeat protein
MNRHSSQSLNWKVLLRSWRRGPASAVEDAKQYITLYPRLFDGWVVLADGLWSMARYDDARRALRRAQQLIPKHLRHRLYRQWGIFYKEKNDLRRPEEWFRKAIRVDPTTSNYILLGATLAKQGKLIEAEKMHRRAISSRTRGDAIDEGHLNLGMVLRAQGKYGEAAVQFAKALTLDPRYGHAKEALRDVRSAIDSERLAGRSVQPAKVPARTRRLSVTARLRR